MHKIKRFAFSLAALLVASSVAIAASASAEMEPGPPPVQVAEEPINPIASKSSSEDSQTGSLLANEFKSQAKLKLEEQKAKVKAKTEAEREKSCDARKANLTKRMANAVSAAKKHKQVIDQAYTRVKAFHDSKNLNVPNYTTLTATVDAAQTAAQASIDALQQLDVNVDCTSQTVADSVSAFQQAVKTTRDSLKAYRKSLVGLIDSLKGASTGTDNSSTNGSSD